VLGLKIGVPEVCAGSLLDSQEGLDDIGREAFGTGGNALDIRLITARVVKVFISFMGLIFLILLILAGWKYMNSRGNEEKVTEALTQIKSAIIGLVIIVAAYVIASFVTDCVMDIASDSSVWNCK